VRDARRSRARRWKTLKSTAKDAATPWRIVTVGAVAGFLMGRSGGGADNAPSVGAKLFGTVAQMLLTTLGTAGAAGRGRPPRPMPRRGDHRCGGRGQRHAGRPRGRRRGDARRNPGEISADEQV
jgi:hypothetical protein